MSVKTVPKIIFIVLIVSIAVAVGYLLPKTSSNISSDHGRNLAAANQPPASCIIVIDGKSYDVQRLRSSHPGGDIFVCGTDMSSVFHGQHGGNLKMIQPYLVK